MEGLQPIWLTWDGDKKLIVRAPEDAKVLKKLNQFEDVEIEYRENTEIKDIGRPANASPH